jgi:hypothetical protein
VLSSLDFRQRTRLLSLFIHSFEGTSRAIAKKNLTARTLVKSSQDGYIRIWRGWCNGSVLPYHIPCPGSRTFDDLLIYEKYRWARSGLSYGCALTFHLDNKATDGCQCTPCVLQRKRISKQEKGTLFNPKISRKWVTVPCQVFITYTCFYRTYFLLGGWSLFAFVCYRVSLLKVESKIYNPFEILGIKSVRQLSYFTKRKALNIFLPDPARQGHQIPFQKAVQAIVNIQPAHASHFAN